MRLVVNDTLDGYFELSTLNEIPLKNGSFDLEHFGILVNFGGPLSFRKDFIPQTIETNQICSFSPGGKITALNTTDENHFLLQFNKAFYCIEIHDKEVSCNGLLFNGLSSLPILQMDEKERESFQLLKMVFLEELEHQDHIQREMLQLLLKRLIIKTTRIARQQLIQKTGIKDEETDLLRAFNALVEKHFREKHKVADYADMLFKSPKTIANLFLKLSEQTPLEIIHQRIILEAKRLLYYTDKPAKEIGYELGFSEPSQFSRLFKKITGQSPSEYKQVVGVPAS
ncbi:helix-turn-helix domain-containing protein [Flexithrix dorotheae]|uniref:helix-turn-helix domain-containing protein n=1 Tax=Flexithrix dorotheae TaxID=70993 RepID=UPI0003612BDD|nr:AraC family transcriptional regulator [Flexithrix dorotheae]